MLRRNRVRDDEYENDTLVRKSFFQRHPVLKWTLIGFAVGLFAAAIALSLVVTLGVGIAPFLAIGTWLGISNAVAATTAGLGIVAGAATAFFGSLFGTISALVNKHRAVKEPAQQYTSSSNFARIESAPVSEQPSNERGYTSGPRMFDGRTVNNESAPEYQSSVHRP